MKQEHRVYLGIVIVGVIIGVAGGISWVRSKNAEVPSKTASLAENTGTSVASSTGESILVSNQAKGEVVAVRAVKVREPRWVVVTEDSGGQPARILGAQKVNPGQTTTEVTLLRGTIAGNVYHAIIYAEDGDGVFDYQLDSPVQDSKGASVESTFNVF